MKLGDLTLNDNLKNRHTETATTSTVDDESLAQLNIPEDKRYSYENVFEEDIPLNKFWDSSDIRMTSVLPLENGHRWGIVLIVTKIFLFWRN